MFCRKFVLGVVNPRDGRERVFGAVADDRQHSEMELFPEVIAFLFRRHALAEFVDRVPCDIKQLVERGLSDLFVRRSSVPAEWQWEGVQPTGHVRDVADHRQGQAGGDRSCLVFGIPGDQWLAAETTPGNQLSLIHI